MCGCAQMCPSVCWVGTKVGTIESLDDSSDIPHCQRKAAESHGKLLRQAEMRTPDPLLRSQSLTRSTTSRAGKEFFPSSSHSHTTIERQPRSVRRRIFRPSLSPFALNFSVQNRRRDLGIVDL